LTINGFGDDHELIRQCTLALDDLTVAVGEKFLELNKQEKEKEILFWLKYL
jgi:hypothetical protein